MRPPVPNPPVRETRNQKREPPKDSHPVRPLNPVASHSNATPACFSGLIGCSPGIYPRAVPGDQSPVGIQFIRHLKAGTEPRHYVGIPISTGLPPLPLWPCGPPRGTAAPALRLRCASPAGEVALQFDASGPLGPVPSGQVAAGQVYQPAAQGLLIFWREVLADLCFDDHHPIPARRQ
jgi:hypothetical protein